MQHARRARRDHRRPLRLLIRRAARRASDAEADLRRPLTGFRMNNFLGTDVHGRTLGLVGFGASGRPWRDAQRASAWRCCTTRHDTGRPGWVDDLDDLLRAADVVSLHVPLTEESVHLIDARRLGLMPSHAVLVNTARRLVVDEEALAVALEDGTIFAAGIDVFEREPEVHLETAHRAARGAAAHIGSATEQTRLAMTQLARRGVVAVLAGERPATWSCPDQTAAPPLRPSAQRATPISVPVTTSTIDVLNLIMATVHATSPGTGIASPRAMGIAKNRNSNAQQRDAAAANFHHCCVTSRCPRA